MKKFHTLILILFAISISSTAYSQSKYGNVTDEEMNMTVYPQDTTANAVILLKDADISFKYNDLYGFQYEYTLAMKIKILKPEGLEQCNRSISYFKIKSGSEEKITSLSGTTYNVEDGKVVKTKLSKDQIFDSSQDGQLMLRKFTMPAAKVGSIVEFKYTITSDFYYELRDFDFQDRIPTAYVSLIVTIPEWFIYNVNSQGYELPPAKRDRVNESFHIKVHNGFERISCNAEKYAYVGQHLSGLKNEGYLWTIDDYKSKVFFELQSTQFPYSMIKYYTARWANIDKKLLDDSNYGGNAKKAGLFKDEINKGELTLDNARKIQETIKSKVKWNGSRRQYPSKNLKDILKEGIGNSADINFLLVNALKSGGFDAYPVFLSTRSNGRIPIANPSLTVLNNTITAVRIDTMMYYTDASSKYGDWNILPKEDMVPQARILDPDGCYWVDLTKLSSGVEYVYANYNFAEDKLQGKIILEQKGNCAMDFRSDYFEQNKDKEEFIEKLAAASSAQISDFTIEGEQDPSSNVKINYVTSIDSPLGDDHIYINPMQIKQFSTNPFRAETRVFPVQFRYPESYLQVVNIAIPEGYVIEELPKSEKYTFGENNSITFLYRIAQNKNVVSLFYQFQLKELMILPTEYESLRDFFSKLVAKNSELIVLKKMTENAPS